MSKHKQALALVNECVDYIKNMVSMWNIKEDKQTLMFLETFFSTPDPDERAYWIRHVRYSFENVIEDLKKNKYEGEKLANREYRLNTLKVVYEKLIQADQLKLSSKSFFFDID